MSQPRLVDAAPALTRAHPVLEGAGLSRGTGAPLYRQVKDALGAGVSARGLEPGDRLPGDHEISAYFGVSRSVTRQALAELEADGLVSRVRGSGTFVAAPKVTEHLAQSTAGLYADVAARGSLLASDVLRQETVPADAAQAAALGIEVGETLVVVERLRRVDGEPWVHTTAHLPARLVPGLVDADLREVSLYELIERRHGLHVSHAHRSVEAAPAPERTAALLGIPDGSPTLVLTSVARTAEGVAFEMFRAFHRGDRSRFDIEVDEGRASTWLRTTAS